LIRVWPINSVGISFPEWDTCRQRAKKLSWTVNGKLVSLGVQLSHLDLLINWVERGIDPSDFLSIDPQDPTKTVAVKGAHQLGFQKCALKYFWAASGFATERSPAEKTDCVCGDCR
jgi:hypothetical protein